jgi:fructosamine-3-kinase
MDELENVIVAIFDPKFYDDLYNRVKFGGGHVKAEAWLLDQGLHPSFVKVAIKKILSSRGW